MLEAKFGETVYDGDSIDFERDGLQITARIERDSCGDRPDQRDCEFWPSHSPDAAGYVAPGQYQIEKDKATRRMNAWLDDEWCYVGVCVTVAKCGVELNGRYDHALWGVESDHGDYLNEVTAELLPEAIKAAQAKLKELQS